jgi:hypothetical protein
VAGGLPSSAEADEPPRSLGLAPHAAVDAGSAGAAADDAVDSAGVGASSSASAASDADTLQPSGLETETRVPRYPAQLPLIAWVVALGLGLAITSGGFALGMWLLFLVPTLCARHLFAGVLRESGAMRGVGLGLIALQIVCASSVVSNLTASGCATTAFWPALAVVLVLFPTGLLPSAWPLAFSALGLTVVLAAFANGETTRCHGTAAGRTRASVHSGVGLCADRVVCGVQDYPSQRRSTTALDVPCNLVRL